MYRGYMRIRNWCFTAWNDKFLNCDIDLIQYLGYGIEICPETGNRHFQGYVEFKKAFTLGMVKKAFDDKTVHLEARKGSQKQAVDYCKKDGEFNEIGELKVQGKRTDIDIKRQEVEDGCTMNEMIETATSYQSLKMAELLLKYKEKKRPIQPILVKWVYGETGCGKTHNCFVDYPLVFRPIKSNEYKWWDGYDGQKEVLLDDIRGNICSFLRLIELTDIYPFKVECKNGSREVQFDTVIITSPYKIEDFCEMYYSKKDKYEQLWRRCGYKQYYCEKIINCPVEETFEYRCTEVHVQKSR